MDWAKELWRKGQFVPKDGVWEVTGQVANALNVRGLRSAWRAVYSIH